MIIQLAVIISLIVLFIHISFVHWILVIGAASGFSVISVVLIDLREAMLKYYEKD